MFFIKADEARIDRSPGRREIGLIEIGWHDNGHLLRSDQRFIGDFQKSIRNRHRAAARP
jgi:hypothetical protein